MTAPAGPDNTSRASAWGDGASRGWTLSLAASGPTVCLVRANEEGNIVVAPATPETWASASALALPAALSGGSSEPAAGGRSTSACRTSKTVTMRFLPIPQAAFDRYGVQASTVAASRSAFQAQGKSCSSSVALVRPET